jgi:hypothetical protein
MPATPPPPLEARWLAANRTAIASIHNTRQRHDAQAAFDATLTRIARGGTARPAPLALAQSVRSELDMPGRYQLHPQEAPIRRSWWAIAFGWFVDRWDAFLKALSKRIHLGPSGSAAIGDVLVVVALLLVAIVAGRMLAVLHIERERRRMRLQPLGSQRSAHALWLQACEAAQRGAYGAAVRTLFAATVTLLDLRGVVHDDASATVNELRRAVRERNAAVESPFVEIARAYTSAAYAERPVDAALWETANAAYGTLLRMVQA